jgi:two-component system sensor histidine kinase/response regulator
MMSEKGRILVIDDELGIREGCRRALQPQGYEVETAATMREGRQKIENGAFDLVLLDVMMPDGRGIELVDTIHQKDPETVCVIITGYATVELAVQAIKQGAYDFISKPFTADMLLITVNQGVEKRRLSQEAGRLQEAENRAAELARAKEEMERLDRFKTDFMWTVAHELRSPVGGAMSLLRTLRRGLAGELNEKQNEILGRIENRMDMLMVLINDLLDLAAGKAIGTDQPSESIELLPVLHDLAEFFSPDIENKKIKFVLEAPETSPLVWATQDGLEKIFRNLISNAIKYTPEGGVVRVNVGEDASGVRIAVSDTGMGIPKADMKHLWEEFFRASNARKSGILGTGLGLSIVKQFVDSFAGTVDVHSLEGKGTTFTITLPVAESTPSKP